jgi:preprotein translocase subunit YajC
MFFQIVQSGALFAAAKSSSSGGAGFYIILLLLVAVYFFYLRPRRAKMLARQKAESGAGAPEIQAGDSVVMTSGIIGRVLSIDGDRASVEIAQDTVVEIQRAALGRRLEPVVPDESDRWASLADHDPEGKTEASHDTPDASKEDGTPGEEHPGGAQ